MYGFEKKTFIKYPNKQNFNVLSCKFHTDYCYVMLSIKIIVQKFKNKIKLFNLTLFQHVSTYSLVFCPHVFVHI